MARALTINAGTIQELWKLASEQSPKEICGLLTGEPETTVLTNSTMMHNYAPDPTQEFWMSPIEVNDFLWSANHARYPCALFHSHPTSRWNLSLSDCQVMRTLRLPMVVVAAQPHPSVVLYEFHQSGQIIMTQNYRVTQEATP